MKIYTKAGDLGQTSLLGGTRVSKSHLRLETYGNIDELNAWIGVLSDYTINSKRKNFLIKIQNDLFVIGANLATEQGKEIAKVPDLDESDITLIEMEIDKENAILSPMTHFILPSGHKEVSFAHVARTVCRRAERAVVRLNEQEPLDSLIIKYLNRLSDYLFILSRAMAKDLGIEETKWIPKKKN
jgi:cob(I)alamin adenosyltransferase